MWGYPVLFFFGGRWVLGTVSLLETAPGFSLCHGLAARALPDAAAGPPPWGAGRLGHSVNPSTVPTVLSQRLKTCQGFDMLPGTHGHIIQQLDIYKCMMYCWCDLCCFWCVGIVWFACRLLIHICTVGNFSLHSCCVYLWSHGLSLTGALVARSLDGFACGPFGRWQCSGCSERWDIVHVVGTSLQIAVSMPMPCQTWLNFQDLDYLLYIHRLVMQMLKLKIAEVTWCDFDCDDRIHIIHSLWIEWYCIATWEASWFSNFLHENT